MLLVGSLAIVTTFGLGWLVSASLIQHSRPRRCLEDVALIFACGLMVNYGIVLCVHSLKTSQMLIAVLSILGLGGFVRYLSRSKGGRPDSSPLSAWVGCLLMLLVYAFQILLLPLDSIDCDARMIWFFHAKVLYFEGSFNLAAGWKHHSLPHVDYPKLNAVLAGQISYFQGYWNEFMPKASLFLLLVPVVCWIFAFFQRSWAFLCLVIVFPFSLGHWLWNGYMDGYLAFYFAVAMLLFGRYMRSRQRVDVISGLCCLSFILQLKNEGMLGFLAGIASIIIIEAFLAISGKTRWGFFHKFVWRQWMPFLMGLIVWSVWQIHTKVWQLNNDLQIGTWQAIIRMGGRLKDGESLLVILTATFFQIRFSVLLVLGLLLALFSVKKHFPLESAPPLIAAILYYWGMVLIYLMTPYDIIWHLNLSVSRTMLPVNTGLFIGMFFLLQQFETGQVALNKTP